MVSSQARSRILPGRRTMLAPTVVDRTVASLCVVCAPPVFTRARAPGDGRPVPWSGAVPDRDRRRLDFGRLLRDRRGAAAAGGVAPRHARAGADLQPAATAAVVDGGHVHARG